MPKGMRLRPTSTLIIWVPLLGDDAGDDDEEIDVATFVNVTGSAHNDSLSGDRFGNHLTGGAGDDSLRGGAGGDVLSGGPGADRMDGGEDKGENANNMIPTDSNGDGDIPDGEDTPVVAA